MPLDSSKGQIADSLRSFFRLTGRIPTRVDELVVPTARVAELDRAPWRSGPIAGSFYNESANVAAEFSAVGVGLPPTAPGQFVVRKVRVVQGTAGAALSYSMIMCGWAAAVATVTDFGAIQKIEQLSKNLLITNVGDASGPHQLIGSDPSILLGSEVWRLRVEAAGTSPPVDQWDGFIAIPNGGALLVWGRTVNITARVAITVEYFPDAKEVP